MRLILTALALLVTLTSDAAAQKRCKKGIPCGGTCISASKTCRVGSGSATSAPSSSERLSLVAPAPDGDAAWVASSRGRVYYRNGCKAAAKLSDANRVYFKTEEAAQAAGLTRSSSKGC